MIPQFFVVLLMIPHIFMSVVITNSHYGFGHFVVIHKTAPFIGLLVNGGLPPFCLGSSSFSPSLGLGNWPFLIDLCCVLLIMYTMIVSSTLVCS